MLAWVFEPATFASLVTLTAMEIVLGIDNIVFLSIISGKLQDPATRKRARQIGLALALIFRILLLLAISWIIGLTTPVFSVFIGLFVFNEHVGVRGLIGCVIVLVGCIYAALPPRVPPALAEAEASDRLT